MKVICIGGDGTWYNPSEYRKTFPWSKKRWVYRPGPKKDDVLVVEGDGFDEHGKFYVFAEWPERKFNAKCFKPLPESTAEFKEVTYSEIKKEAPVSAN